MPDLDPTKKDDSNKTLEELAKGLKGLQDAIVMMATEQKEQRSVINDLKSGRRSGGSEDPNDDPSDGGGNNGKEVNLETMSRAEMLNHAAATIIKHVEKHLIEPLSSQLSDLNTRTGRFMTQGELNSLIKDDGLKDINEWRKEMADKIKDNPGLSLKEAYDLVRKANPEKAEKMDEQHKMGKFAEPEPKSGKAANTMFGGLPPGGVHDTEQPTDVDPKDAGKVAYEKIFGDGEP